jgi:HlyD family secretion protein
MNAPIETPQAPMPTATAAVKPAAEGVIAGPPAPTGESRRKWPLILAGVIVVAAGCAGAAYWWINRPPGLPAGIAFSNGRLEADEIDISTKFAGRISEILADEGDLVKKGQVLARMDTRDLSAQFAAAQAQTTQAQQTIAQGQANLIMMAAELKYRDQELERAKALIGKGFITHESLDERQSQYSTAVGALNNAQAVIAAATQAVQIDAHNADLIEININDDTLVAPKDGPIQYRLANIGEVLAAGGKVFSMLDATYVYMDIFLPTETAGKVAVGDDAKILLDALPNTPIDATVTSLDAVNEFTPKTVETKTDRDKLMFRIRVRIAPELLRRYERQVRSGLPGLTYVRWDPKTPWPDFLQKGTVH